MRPTRIISVMPDKAEKREGCGFEKRGEEGKRGPRFQKAQTEHGENALKVEGRVRRTALNEGRTSQ